MGDSTSNQLLTNVVFNGNNYLPWARAVSIALGGKSKDGYIDGTKTAPVITEKVEYAKWKAGDLSVISAIFNTMDPKLYKIFAYTNSSRELWESLKEMYGQAKNSSRIFEIQKNLAHISRAVLC
jgi:gag-polypeptide of LTR copia-type